MGWPTIFEEFWEGGAVYVRPTASEFRRRTGLDENVEGLTADEFDAKVILFYPDAETRTALALGEAFRAASDDLSTYKAQALAIAVTYRAAHDYLMAVADQKVTGTEDPLLMEEAARIREQAEAFEAKAEAYDLLIAGIAEEPALRRPAAAILAAGVEPSSIGVSPVERLRNLSERDNYVAGSRRGAGRRCWP